MPNTANLKMRLTDDTQVVTPAQAGLYGVMVALPRGPVNDCSRVFSSYTELVRVHGEDHSFPDCYQVKEALEKGAKLRVLNVRNVTAAVIAEATSTITDGEVSPTELFELVPKQAGASFNNLQVTVEPATNGVDDAFNVAILYTDTEGNNQSELYQNLIITGNPTVLESDYLLPIEETSLLVDVVYKDLSSTTGQVRPEDTVVEYAGGINAGTDTTTATADDLIEMSSTELFKLQMKYPGELYNEVLVSITDASNGDPEAFNLLITFVDGIYNLSESYQNLKIVGNPTKAGSDFLNELEGSRILTPEYLDLSGTSGALRPDNNTISYSGGDDGDVPLPGTYSQLLPLWDDYDDIWGISAPTIQNVNFNISLAAYAAQGKLVRGMIYIGDSNDEEVLIARRLACQADTRYVDIFAGTVDIVDNIPLSPTSNRTISPIGGITGLMGASDAEYGPWYSAAGQNRGIYAGARDVVNNYGSSKKLDILNRLANHQINVIINRDGRIMLWGNFTAQRSLSQASFTSIMKLVAYIKRSLGPTLESFIEEPLDLFLVRRIFNTVTPFMNELNSTNKRALHQPVGYQWLGDQGANSMEDFEINNPTDFRMGKYKAKLRIKPINSLQEFDLEISLTPAGVSFSL